MFKKLTIYIAIFMISFNIGAIQPSLCDGESILQNSGFEEVTESLPAGWYTDAYLNSSDAVKFTVEEGNAHSGSRYCVIENLKPNDSRFGQDILIQPGSVYRISYWVKVDNVKEGGGGVNVTLANGIYYSDFIYSTNGQWKQFQHYVKTRGDGDEVLRFWIRLGGFGAVAEGKAAFDDVRIELVENPDPSLKIIECFSDSESSEYVTANEGHKTGSNSFGNALIYMIAGILIISLIIYAEIRLMKRHKANTAADGEAEVKKPQGRRQEAPSAGSAVASGITDYVEDIDIKD